MYHRFPIWIMIDEILLSFFESSSCEMLFTIRRWTIFSPIVIEYILLQVTSMLWDYLSFGNNKCVNFDLLN